VQNISELAQFSYVIHFPITSFFEL